MEQTTELRMLIVGIILGFIQIALQAASTTKQRGSSWNMGARDEAVAPVKGVAGRLERALKNFLESFPLFVGAVAAVHFASRTGGISAVGAQIYVISRVVYIPLYAFGIPVVRTLVWVSSMAGIGMMLFALM